MAIPPKLVDAIKIMYEKNSAIFLTQKGETEFFEVITSLLQGDTLAPFLFVTVLDFALRKSINTDGIMLIRRQKCHHPPIHLADLDFADDIAQLEETICQAERVLHKVEAETLSILLINVQKTKYMSVKSCTVEPSFKKMNGSDIGHSPKKY